MTAFEIQFHGVRGSLASPGIHTAAVGGHTSCIEIGVAGRRIVLDAGTGLAALGDRILTLGDLARPTTILLSHVHWDHIQGIPFFKPIYIAGSEIEIISGPNGFMPLAEVLRRQMSPPFFPVAFDELSAEVRARDVGIGARFMVGEVQVTVARLNHPDPVYGYRLDYDGHALVYATDTEHYSCVDPTLRALAQGADVLIYDAQYTPEEYRGDQGPAKVGWGHSTFEAAAELARQADVERLVLFHHDPARSDAQVEAIERRARLCFPNTVAAREHMMITIGAMAQRSDALLCAGARSRAGAGGQSVGVEAA
ncbi:MBL fold metallo-hydrolase [Haliangium ochraceum]|uniref:Beta-lactamase domain protein n=1 Tax=Haliangium ochraceum (strain DSM 14365 / JCM 11303 / SMP-2) TaxID=502025 RepID=D0LX98_HALO1|nr:MBL fold metallo-hydrolase [Haliangium ochraceum]ACY16140.1 beta-lactamase domain protein [Haliangium ochraceum DSM 14365]